MPKSIGTYNEFVKENTNKQVVSKQTTGGGTRMTDNMEVLEFQSNLIILLGDRKKGDYVTM